MSTAPAAGPLRAVVAADGRQSPQALAVQRGTCRLLASLGFATVTELGLASGHRADIVALSGSGDLWIVEIKSSVEDFRSDQKWPAYHGHCDQLYFAVPETVPLALLPDEAGIILADRYGAAIIREAPELRLAAARRRAVQLRFARAAALRLQALVDPDFTDVSF